MNVCYFGGFDVSYARNVVLRTGLQQAGAMVSDCNSLADFKPFRIPELLAKFWRLDKPDIVVVGACGHAYVPLARLLASLTGAPLLFDAFVSQYDTSILDRREAGERSLRARYALMLDRVAVRCADVVLMDTAQHAEYYARLVGEPVEKFRWVFIGADDTLFSPRPQLYEGRTIVTFVGTFIPLQGVPYILEAAELLKQDQDVAFELVGSGQTYVEARRLVEERRLGNVRFVGAVPTTEVPKYLQRATMCLGIFGDTGKTQRVIPNKVFEALAMEKPVITADTPASRSLLTHRKDAFLVPAANGRAIAEAVQELKHDSALRDRIAKAGSATYTDRASSRLIGQQLSDICHELIAKSRA